MSIIIAVTLLITFTIDGHDYQREEKQTDLQSCWKHAGELMEKIVQDNQKIDSIGIGCFIDLNHDPV